MTDTSDLDELVRLAGEQALRSGTHQVCVDRCPCRFGRDVTPKRLT